MKVALVTGVASGIGLATAKKLLENGIRVVGISRRATMEDLGESFTYVSGDVSVKADRDRFIDTALSKYGRIDILVNVAGVAPKVRADLLTMTEESYDYVMNINTKGTMFLTQRVANEMIKNEGAQKGSIVNISSLSAYTSSVNRGEYCISKAGVSMITTLFADRLAEYGIMVNEIRPGIIATDMTSTVQEKYDKLIDGGLLPIKRWGQPEDIASAAYALCDGSLPYMTGQALNIDGGFHIRRL
jgi:NAD(P)-dependent dehydrogenase (short-subunit alcohol dehydrogenase family)